MLLSFFFVSAVTLNVCSLDEAPCFERLLGLMFIQRLNNLNSQVSHSHNQSTGDTDEVIKKNRDPCYGNRTKVRRREDACHKLNLNSLAHAH